MPLNRYEVRQPNGTVSVLQLDDADAKRLGVFKEPEASTKKAPAPANKSRTAKTKKA